MCHAGRDIELTLVDGRELDAEPAAEPRRGRIDIHCDVPHRPGNAADQLGLGMLSLQVQATQDSTGRLRLVVLHEDIPDAGSGEVAGTVRLHEEATLIAVHDGLDPLDAGRSVR